MPKNQELLNTDLFGILRSRGYSPTMLSTSGKEIPVPEEAEVFQFTFTKDGKEYGTVTLSIDGLHKLVVYSGDDVASSPTGEDGGTSWYTLLKQLKRFSQQHQLSFEIKNSDHLKYDMAKRNHTKVDEAKSRQKEGTMSKKMSENAKWRQGYSASGHPAGHKHASGEVGPVGGTFTNEPSGYDGETSKVPVQKHRDQDDPLAKRNKYTYRGKPFSPSTTFVKNSLKQDIKAAKGKHGPVGSLPEGIAEGYHATGRKTSYSDNIPEVKIVLQHSRPLEEGEKRYRSIEKIFIENAQGERFAVPTNKPGLARVYARHIAEGGTPYDQLGKHITELCEEYSKMAGFVRATRSKQFNESTQSLVNEGINHYQKLRETLHKLAGHRGYNAYFESWSPTLTEDEDTTDLSEMFATNDLDPRIESVMPILRKLNKTIAEMTEVGSLSEWADDIIEEAIDDGHKKMSQAQWEEQNAQRSMPQAKKDVAKRERDDFERMLASVKKRPGKKSEQVDEVSAAQGRAAEREFSGHHELPIKTSVVSTRSRPWVLKRNGRVIGTDSNVGNLRALQRKQGGTIEREGSLSESGDSGDESGAIAQLSKLAQPIGINGGGYTYFVDVTKQPLRFTASDGSVLKDARTLHDIADWMDDADEWLDFLEGHEDLSHLIEYNIVRPYKKRTTPWTDQEEHENQMDEGAAPWGANWKKAAIASKKAQQSPSKLSHTRAAELHKHGASDPWGPYKDKHEEALAKHEKAAKMYEGRAVTEEEGLVSTNPQGIPEAINKKQAERDRRNAIMTAAQTPPPSPLKFGTKYPDSEKGVVAFMRDPKEVNQSFTERLDIGGPHTRVFADQSVEGVWGIDNYLTGTRVIVYLGGYRGPMGDIRDANDFEEGEIPSKTMKRYREQNDIQNEGVLSKVAGKLMGAAPTTPKYKVGQEVSYSMHPGQEGGSGRGKIESYSNGHYMINGKPVNHHEIKQVHEGADPLDRIKNLLKR